VLVLGVVGDRPLEEIAAVDPALHVIDARGVFEVEYTQTWPVATVHRNVFDWERGYEHLPEYQARR
jgi:hypothetical protein